MLLVGWDITFGYVVVTILDSASCFLPTSSYLSFMGLSLVSPIGMACISMWTHYQCRLASSGGLLPSADLSLHLTSFVNVCRALCIQCMQNHSHCINGTSDVCCCYYIIVGGYADTYVIASGCVISLLPAHCSHSTSAAFHHIFTSGKIKIY